MPKGGWTFVPPAGVVAGGREYFAEYARQRDAYFGNESLVDVEEDGDEEEVIEVIELLEAAAPVDASELGQKARAAHKAAIAMGWTTHAWRSRVRVAPVLFLSASREDAKSEHVAGDVRFAGYDASWFCIEARHPDADIAFQAQWIAKHKTKLTTTFKQARVRDALGIPVENWVSYRPIKVHRGKDSSGKVVETEASFQRNVERSERMAAQQTQQYNDGTSRLQHVAHFNKATDFEVWLRDWTTQFTNKKEESA